LDQNAMMVRGPDLEKQFPWRKLIKPG